MAALSCQLPEPPFATATTPWAASPMIGLKTERPVLVPLKTRVRSPAPLKPMAPALVKVSASEATPEATPSAPPAGPTVKRRSVEAVTPV